MWNFRVYVMNGFHKFGIFPVIGLDTLVYEKFMLGLFQHFNNRKMSVCLVVIVDCLVAIAMAVTCDYV